MKKGCLISLLIAGVLGGGFVLMIIMLVSLGSSNSVNFTSAPIAIVNIEGPIFEVDSTLKELEEFRVSESVKAVVVRINSPGGAVAPSQELYRQLIRLKEADKKVVISMGTVAASGGYYIAAAGDKIMANSGTITGSIGVIMENFGMVDVIEFLKLEPRTIKRGKYKDAGTPFRKMEPFEKDYLQSLVDNMYEIFLDDIAKARKISKDKLKDLAEGRIYTGLQAKEAGLVDELGNLYDAIELAKKEAGLPADASVSWPRKPSPLEAFLEQKAMMHYVKKFLMQTHFRGLPSWSLQATGI